MRCRGFLITPDDLLPEGITPPHLFPIACFQAGYLQAIKDYLSFHYKKNIILKVTSGYRNEQINKEVGGQPTSNHIYRLDDDYIRCASDIVPLNAPIEEVFGLLAPFQGEIYRHTQKGFIHIGQNGKTVKNHWVQ